MSRVQSAAEAIASKDNNNLYLTSRFFADPERYRAFCAYYALMRVVDDRIDDIPDRAQLSDDDRRWEHEVVTAWEESILDCYAPRGPSRAVVDRCGHPDAAFLLESFAGSLATFRVPHALWANFFRSMHWDLDHDRFETWQEFLTYAEGASVAPTTIYLILLSSRRDPATGALRFPHDFDLMKCGQDLGIFAYLGHIVRDLAEDLATGKRGLLYVSREDMAAHGVTEGRLFSDLERRRASAPTRSLVADLLGRARRYLGDGRLSMSPLRGNIETDCSFILELIVTMYERVIRNIEVCGHDPLADRHWLEAADKQAIVNDVAMRTGFERTTLEAPTHR